MTRKRLDYSRLSEKEVPPKETSTKKTPIEGDLPQPVLNSPENRVIMNKLMHYRMPYGKYKDRRLVDLPEPYVVWYSQNGFPKGELGQLLGIVYEIKANGLEYLFKRR